MIELIFTIDYEIYGNGKGSLKELVLEPARQLKTIFDKVGAKLVFFAEAAELEKIEEAQSDPSIRDVKIQLKELYIEGHEIALHLHPQWYKGYYNDGKWQLDYSEYNLCTLPEKRIVAIVHRAVNYLRAALDEQSYTPLSFRAGNWLFQPTQTAAKILCDHGIRIDSSVFKGGLQHQNRLDYRQALNNGYFWKFKEDVNKSSINGEMIEIPIYSKMVAPWRKATKKRLELQHKAPADNKKFKNKIDRLLDLARPLQPLKLDFCRMTIDELIDIMDSIIKEDQKRPATYKPIVAIGHTKDLFDFETVESFLVYLKKNKIKVETFKDVYEKCLSIYH